MQAARAREVQAAQMEQLQRDMAAAMLAAKEHSGAATSLGLHKVGPGAVGWGFGLALLSQKGYSCRLQ